MPKVFDCFTFFNELDLLEIRFNLLDEYVDHFVLVESNETFSGKMKPLYFMENKDRFAKWQDKIIHIDMPLMNTPIAFERHYACYEAIEKCILDLAQPEDIFYCSDLDEIWKPQVVDDKVHSLEQLNYGYWLNNRSSEEWTGTLVSKAKNCFVGYNKLNRSVKPNVLPNGGWHFTNMGGADQIRKKLEAYDHTEYNDEFIKEDIEYRMENNEDYVGRTTTYQGKPFTFYVDEVDLPKYLLDNKKKYKHLFK